MSRVLFKLCILPKKRSLPRYETILIDYCHMPGVKGQFKQQQYDYLR